MRAPMSVAHVGGDARRSCERHRPRATDGERERRARRRTRQGRGTYYSDVVLIDGLVWAKSRDSRVVIDKGEENVLQLIELSVVLERRDVQRVCLQCAPCRPSVSASDWSRCTVCVCVLRMDTLSSVGDVR